jgi:DNA-binding GntR family transcriptional regulator
MQHTSRSIHRKIHGNRMIRRRLLRDDVYEAILDAIGEGRHAPGDPLSDITLSQQLGVSRTPVREALLRLEQEGCSSRDRATASRSGRSAGRRSRISIR